MSSTPRFDHIDIVARDYDATIGFYRRLGLNVDRPGGDIRHARVELGGVEIHIDDEQLASLSNSSWRSSAQPRVVINFQVSSRREVDARYADLTGARYTGVQAPHDAFWGARYAIVADPDGTHVGLTSPIDDDQRHWPPRPAPGPGAAT